jgi:transposase-like protein
VDMPRQRETVEVITSDQRRRRWSAAQKQALVRRTYEPGMSVSLVARQEGVSASLLFQWRKLDRQGALVAVSAGEAVVPASELAAARAEIAKLQRILGKKTLENEILREAVEISVEKSGLRARPCCPRTRHEDGLRHFGRARSNLRQRRRRPADWVDGRRDRTPTSDGELVAEIAAEIADLPSYGYRRAAAHCDGH